MNYISFTTYFSNFWLIGHYLSSIWKRSFTHLRSLSLGLYYFSLLCLYKQATFLASHFSGVISWLLFTFTVHHQYSLSLFVPHHHLLPFLSLFLTNIQHRISYFIIKIYVPNNNTPSTILQLVLAVNSTKSLIEVFSNISSAQTIRSLIPSMTSM